MVESHLGILSDYEKEAIGTLPFNLKEFPQDRTESEE